VQAYGTDGGDVVRYLGFDDTHVAGAEDMHAPSRMKLRLAVRHHDARPAAGLGAMISA
jgi:hypothetical protein